MAMRSSSSRSTARSLQRLRREYTRGSLEERRAPADPLMLFRRWLSAAIAGGLPEPHAMTLATATRNGRPSARIVLLKRADRRGFTFGTNYESRKGRELAANPQGELVFFWSALDRQVRIRGRLSRTTQAESRVIFSRRPRASQLAAWASPQSGRLPDRAALEARVAEVARRFEGGPVPLPPFWGGYRLVPREIEFWQGRMNRLHDRLLYARSAGGRGGWRVVRLAP